MANPVGTIVERLITAIGFAVDETSAKTALQWSGRIVSGIAAGSAALAAYGVSQAREIVRQSDFARSLATSVEQWSAWEYAAGQSNVEAQDFRAGLISLTGAIEQAGSGSADTQKLFRSLGVAWAGADGKLRTSLELLPELADGLNKLSDGDKAAAMIRIFGEDDGAKLFRLISTGSKGMAALRAEGQELGLTIDKDAVAAAERLTGGLTQLGAIVRGVGIQIFRQIGPPLGRLVDRLVAAAKASDGWVRTGIDRSVRALGNAFRVIDGPAGDAVAAVAAFGALFVGAQAVASVPILGGVTTAVNGLGMALFNVSKAAAVAGAALLGIPLGTFLFFVGAAVATAGAFYLILDEIMVTARGGDSVIRRLADAFGVGAETQRFFAASVKAASATLALGVDIASDFATGIAAIGTGVVAMVKLVAPYMEQLVGWVQYLVGALPKGFGVLLSGVASGLGLDENSAIARAGRTYQRIGQATQDGPQAQARLALGTAAGVLEGTAGQVDRMQFNRDLGEFQQERARFREGGLRPPSAMPPITIKVDGAGNSELARRVGREAEAATLQALDQADAA